MLGDYKIRTDLALEARERFDEKNVELRGVEVKETYDQEKEIRTTVVKIFTENGAKAMGRPQGNYITIEAPNLSSPDEGYHREVSEEIAAHLTQLINLKKEQSHSGGRPGKSKHYSRCSWSAGGGKSSYDKAYYQGIRTDGTEK